MRKMSAYASIEYPRGAQRRPNRCTSTIILSALCFLAGGCGQEQTNIKPAASVAKTQFSSDDRRAAKALSIDMRQDLISYSSLYVRNLVCETAITRMTDILAEVTAINPQQKSALLAAREAYSRNLLRAAKDEGKSSDDIAIDRRTQMEAPTDRAVQLQSGMACLRGLLNSNSGAA